MHLFIDRDGGFWKRVPGELEREKVELPSGVDPRDGFKRADLVNYRAKNCTLIVGQFDENLIWLTDVEKLYAMGVDVATLDTVEVGFGASTGITANSVQYSFSFIQLIGGKVRVEGEISAETAPLTFVNKNALISGLPTSATSERVNYKRLYRRDNGGLRRFVAHIALGTSTYSDNTRTLALGAPSPVERGTPPLADMVEIFHDRAWYRSNEFPDRVYYSEIAEMEAVGELSYLKTRDGEDITGLAKCGDELLLFCAHASYRIIGYTAADFDVKKISPTFGCISNGSIVNINEILFFASEQGLAIYNGAFRYISEDLKTYWRDDYKDNVLAYQDCVGLDDRQGHVYKLLIPKSSAFAYVGHYDSVFRSGQADWVIDSKGRKETTLGNLSDWGSFRTEIHSGSCDGWVRKDNIPENSHDDDDEDRKTIKIHTGAILFGDPGGNREDGKKFTALWSYVQSEEVPWVFYALGGDRDVVSAILPDNTSVTNGFKDTRAASAVASVTALDTHDHGALERVQGRALQVRIELQDGIGFKYAGFGGIWGPGGAGRPPTE